jgi:hypothetical protein
MEKNTAIPIRELYKIPSMEFVNGFKVNSNILFEDGIVIYLNSNEIKLQRYLIDLLLLFKDMKLTSSYCINNFYNNGYLSSSTINKCFETMLIDIVNTYCKVNGSRDILDLVYETMFKLNNKIENELVYNNLQYMFSVNILDFLEFQFKENLLKSMQEVHVDKTNNKVNNTYKVLNELAYSDESLTNNIICILYKAGTINPNQLYQLLASRGYATEMDSSLFKYPIAGSFTLGLTNSLYDIAIESRGAAKAKYLGNQSIYKTEWFGRELQLVLMSVERVIDGDCGNNDYMLWFVKIDDETGKNDLPNLVGKRYFNEITQQEDVISKNDTHLIGTTVKIRTVNKCRHPNKREICSACFGDLSYSLHKHSNVGHICGTVASSKFTTNLLKTKHITSSAISSKLNLINEAKRFFNVKQNKSYAFKSGLISKSTSKFKLIITQKEFFGLKDLNSDINVYKLNLSRISRIESIIIEIDKNNKKELVPITIRDSKKYGYFTYKFLKYVLESNYVLDDYDRYVIDLSYWTTTESIITMPDLEYNFLALSENFKTELNKLKYDTVNGSVETPESLLLKLFDIINVKLDVNLAILEVIVYGYTVKDLKNGNYDLARGSKDPQLVNSDGIIHNRSVSAMYGWEKVLQATFSPSSFDGNNAISHPADVLIKPNEDIKYHREKNKIKG